MGSSCLSEKLVSYSFGSGVDVVCGGGGGSIVSGSSRGLDGSSKFHFTLGGT